MPQIRTPIQRVTARGRTRYRVTVDIGTRAKRRQTKRTFDTMREAKAFLATTRADVEAGRHIPASKMTFDALADQWLAEKSLTVRPNTHNGYQSAVNPARDAFGHIPIQEVTRADIEDLVARMVGEGRVKRTVEYLLGLLRQIFNRALDEDLIVKNPAVRVKPAGKPSAKPVAFTATEMRDVRRAIVGHRLEAGFRLSQNGLRRSEVLGLRWSDIDFTVATLTVTRSRVDVAGSRSVIGEPKTQRGRCTLPLDSELVAVLKRVRAEQQEIYGLAQVRDGFLVVDEFGQPLRPERFSDLWREVLKDHNIRYLDLRAARRSSATLMRDMGVPDHHVAAWHGHDEAVMRRNYSVAMDAGLKAAGECLSEALREAL